METDQELVIGARFDTEDLEKQLKRETKNLEKYGKELEELNNKKVKVDLDLEKARKNLEEFKKSINFEDIKKDYEKNIFFREETARQNPHYGAKPTTYEIAAQDQYERALDQLMPYEKVIDSIKKKQENINKEIDDTIGKQDEVKQNIDDINNKMKEGEDEGEDYGENIDYTPQFEGLGKKITQVTGKIKTMLLSMFGIRTLFSAISQAINMIKSDNDEVSNKIGIIRNALAVLFERVVVPIVDFVFKLMVYLNHILIAWFGIDLFAKDFSKSMKKSVGSAKALKKQLAGFDEMNILNKDGSTNLGGGGGLDFSAAKDVEIPEWVQWIADHKEEVLTWLGNIAIAIASIWGIIKGIQILGKMIQGLATLKELSTILSGLSSLQIFGMMAGIVIAAGGLFDLIIDIVNGTATLNNLLVDLGEILIGVGIALVAFNASNPIGWISIGIGLIGTLIGLFREEEEKVYDNTYALESNKNARKSLNDATQDYVGKHEKYLNAVKAEKKAHDELVAAEKKNKVSGKELYEQVLIGGTQAYNAMSKEQKQVYSAYVKYLDKTVATTKAQQEMTEADKEQSKAYIFQQAEIAKTTGEYDKFNDTLQKMFENRTIDADTMHDAIAIAFDGISFEAKQTFVNNLPNAMKETFMTVEKNIKKMNEYAKAIDKADKKANNLQKVYKYIGWLDATKWAKGGIVQYAKGGVITKLAPGGVINRPGKGVPLRVGGAIGGERGREGVIPLTDSQQMALLGEAIGRYVNVNATVPVYVGNRQIAREIRKINAEDNFAFNG